MTNPRARAARRGMTLIEISLALAIVALIGTITWGSVARAFDAYETVTDIDRRYHNVRVAMNRIAKEVSMAYLTSARRHRGAERKVIQMFKYEEGSPLSTLHFASFAHQVFLKDAKESDQAEISYFGANDPDESGVVNLMRREAPRIDADWDEGGRADVLAEDVKAFSLRFFDPRKDDWTTEWDTERPEFAGRLPTFVEVNLTVLDESGEEMKFTTKTRVNLTQEMGTL